MKNKFLFYLLLFVLLSCSKSPSQKSESIIEKDSLTISKTEIIKDILPKKQKKVKRPEFTKGIYLSAWTVATKKFYTILDSAEVAGINTVVFDVKNMNGDIFYNYTLKPDLTGENIKSIFNVEKVVQEIHSRKMRAVARVVMFHDQFLVEHRPDFRPQKQDGSAWKENKNSKPSWLDCSNENVQDYIFTFIKDLLKFNIDELQMDYIRFPTQGNLSEAVFVFQKEDALIGENDSTYVFREKSDIIENIVIKVRKLCEEHKVDLSADIFAIVAWQRKIDIKNTGQDIQKMSKYLDAIHPMIYSSHFDKQFGYRNNIWNEPYYIMYKGTKLTKNFASENCKIIPYIQANSWRVNYKAEYIYAQIKAIEDLKGDGYILWNASNKYLQTLKWIERSKN